MTPLGKIESERINSNNFLFKFSVHKHNSYIPYRAITLEEAARCVVLQSKWASTHELVSLPGHEKLDVNVTLISELLVEGLGIFATIEIQEVNEQPCRQQFIVTESESHWYFLDYSLASVVKDIEVGQGATATVAQYN
jgi:hypothetical protein